MQQIKIFEGDSILNNGTEENINKWLKDNPNVKITNINRIPMYDLYNNSNIEVCNQ